MRVKGANAPFVKKRGELLSQNMRFITISNSYLKTLKIGVKFRERRPTFTSLL